MSARRRIELGSLTAVALALTLGMLWLHTWQVTLNDYGSEAMGPLGALLHGHLWRFLQTAPAYGPSLMLRAPFALIPSLAHGTELLVYRISALPCLLALAALAVWIAAQLRSAGRGWLAVALTLAVCLLNPLTYFALSIGHPEEVLGGVLCVVAVLAALRGHCAWAGILLGLAIANKEWAIVAAGPVLVALPAHRIRTLLVAGGVLALLLGPMALATGSAKSATGKLTVANGGTFFYTQQLWWFLGQPQHWVPAMHGQLMAGFRFPPAWLQGRAHILIAWIGVPLSWFAFKRRMARENALALLAMLLLLRCALDPWDLVYYPIPFIIALLSWETLVRQRAPVGAALATGAAYLLFEQLPLVLSANEQAVAFMVPCLFALVALALVVYRRRAPAARPQSTTSSSFVNLLRRRAPLSVTTVRSSIRTPSVPGR
ncbi:MAG: hypothetical protein ABSC56_08635 [Solirubrobacteraceae bacterium]